MKQSNALWPAGVCHTKRGNNISTDTHETESQAQAVCNALYRDGFGGEGERYPIKTWVSDVQDPPIIPADGNELHCLRHMLGADSEKSHRNYMSIGNGSKDAKSMQTLLSLGLVKKGMTTASRTFYHATTQGMRTAGLTAADIDDRLKEQQ